MSDAPTFRFKGRACAIDRTGYYYPRWDRATPVTVLATTKAEANTKAFAMLGEPADSGRDWNIIWDRIDETLEEPEKPQP